MKKIIAVLLSLVLIVGTLPAIALTGAAEDVPVVDESTETAVSQHFEQHSSRSETVKPSEAKNATSGTTGDCTWTLDGTELTISGNGRMGNYFNDVGGPWGRSITKVTIENGVTSIGKDAFYKCSVLTSIKIPDGVTSIGNCAFCECR